MELFDTIVAISTPPGRGGIGVVRLSGTGAWEVAESFLRFSATKPIEPRVASLAELLDDDGKLVDSTVVTLFAAPRSYTGEDLVEISCHGSPVILRHCVERAVTGGARLAEPGEFTLRAYLNGRIDLPQAEAIRDLIDSTTLYQAKVAAQQAGGSLARRLKPVKDQLIELIALLEAGIDFAEDDISVASPPEIHQRVEPISASVKRLAESFRYGKLVTSGFTLAIAGRPNVGKSSLFNRLLERDRAIVNDAPGTTRDTISETAVVEGFPVKFVDTAGIRSATDVVESLGIERSYEAMADADLTLLVLDASSSLTDEDHRLLARVSTSGVHLLVWNKVDRGLDSHSEAGGVRISALTGEGIGELRQAIGRAMTPEGRCEQEGSFITSLRHERLLQEALAALEQAQQANASQIPHEMILLDIYAALRALDEITGATTADDILNRIFSTFCIGK